MNKSFKKGENIAVRSESIIEARFSLTSKQNDLLDMLLCEIENDDKYQYVLSVDKYKDLYYTDTSNLYRDLKKAVKSFEGKGFRLINKETGEEIYYSWFSKIHYKPKQGEIQVNVDLDFKKMLCEVKKRIYYKIEYTLNFNSIYSKRIYYYLKSFEDTGWRLDDIEKLQSKLECPNSYKNFANFEKYVLKVADNEINADSDISFKYEAIKKGKKVTHIKFYVQSKNKDTKALSEVAVGEVKVEDGEEGLIEKVKKFIKEDIGDISIKTLLKTANNDLELIKEKYKMLNRQKHVDDVGGWLNWAIQTDYKDNKVSATQTSLFNNFEQRTYDYDALEKRLLGWT